MEMDVDRFGKRSRFAPRAEETTMAITATAW
jgi:hypothetical protein